VGVLRGYFLCFVAVVRWFGERLHKDFCPIWCYNLVVFGMLVLVIRWSNGGLRSTLIICLTVMASVNGF
jgi:hypothetical protein